MCHKTDTGTEHCKISYCTLVTIVRRLSCRKYLRDGYAICKRSGTVPSTYKKKVSSHQSSPKYHISSSVQCKKAVAACSVRNQEKKLPLATVPHSSIAHAWSSSFFYGLRFWALSHRAVLFVRGRKETMIELCFPRSRLSRRPSQ